jgi:hypothetical protein
MTKLMEPWTRDGALAAARRMLSAHSANCGPREYFGDAAYVLRHSGRGGTAWRVAAHRFTLKLAEKDYNVARERMRQGAVALWHHGQIVHLDTAPRLRTRW